MKQKKTGTTCLSCHAELLPSIAIPENSAKKAERELQGADLKAYQGTPFNP